MGILNTNAKDIKKMFAKRQELFLAVAQNVDVHLGFPGIEKVDFRVLERLAAKKPLAEGEVGLGTIGEDDEHCAILCIGAENGMHMVIAQDDSVSFTQAGFTQNKIVDGLFYKVILKDDASEDLKELLKSLNTNPTTRAEMATIKAQIEEAAAATKVTVDVTAETKTEMSFKEKLAAITSPRKPIASASGDKNVPAAAAAAAEPGLPATATGTTTVAVMTDPSTSDLAGLEGAGSVIVIRGGEVEKPKS